MYTSRWRCAAAVLGIALLVACSSGPAPAPEKPEAKQEAAGPPQPVAAMSAFYSMYKPARTWARDLLALSLTRGEIPEVQNEDGKAGMWTAVFVSPSLREARTLTYAVADSGTAIRKGVSIGGTMAWSGATPQSKPFQTTEFLVDSDAAYKTAAEDAGPWLKKHAGTKLNAFTLVSMSRFAAPVWYLMWGTKSSGYAVFVDAATGAIVGKK